MIPDKEKAKQLEELLDRLFTDGGEPTQDDFILLNLPVSQVFPNNCCDYNYAGYNRMPPLDGLAG